MLQYSPWSQDVLEKLTELSNVNGFSCLDVDLSGECPYRCVYCETQDHHQKAIINIEKVCSLISTEKFPWVYICGLGEPTYGSNEQMLLSILSCCKDHGAKCSIFSNLSNLTSKIEEYIREGILYVLFKLDSQNTDVIKRLYNLDDIETHLRNIDRIVDLVQCDGDVTNIAASIVPTKDNVDEIPHLVEWCIKNKIFPLVAQLEYAGSAKEVYDKLFLDDNQLKELKNKIEDYLGEEYRVPFCPSLISGICITSSNEITIDHKTGLSCHSFWLTDPNLDVVCEQLGDDTSIEEIADKLVTARIKRYKDFKIHISDYCKHKEVFGGCGGNKMDVFKFYNIAMDKALKLPDENLTKINRYVYLDNNATTSVSNEVAEDLKAYLFRYYHNPNSDYGRARNVRREIEKAKASIAGSLHCNIENLVFTSCGSESNSLAIHSCLNHNPLKKTIVSTEIEHKSVLNYLSWLKDHGYTVYNIPVLSSGQVDIHALLQTPPNWEDVCCASVMYVNNETGVINDIKELTRIMHEHSVPVHCDAVQAFGKLDIDINALGVDYLSISGHKIHAPKGVGALFVRDRTTISPQIFGTQEYGCRGGTQNVLGIIGFGKAANIAYSDASFITNNHNMGKLRDELEARLRTELDGVSKFIIHGEAAPRVSNTSNIGFVGVDAYKLLHKLEARGIYVSNGAACNHEPSHVLKAMKSPVYENGAIRVSLSADTEPRDIEYFIANLVKEIKSLMD